MSKLSTSFKKGAKMLSWKINKNSPAILLTVGIIGGVTAAVTAVKAAPSVSKKLNDISNRDYDDKKDEYKDTAMVIVKGYGPSIGMGVCSILCLVGSYKANTKRIASYAAAYHMTDAAFRDYKEHVADRIGPKKVRDIEDSLDLKTLDNNPPVEENIINTGNGTTLFYDSLTARYFYSDINHIRSAVNELNKRILSENEMYVCLNDYYDEIGIPRADVGELLGWNIDNLVSMGEPDAKWFTTNTSDSKPCGVIKFNTAPIYEYEVPNLRG